MDNEDSTTSALQQLSLSDGSEETQSEEGSISQKEAQRALLGGFRDLTGRSKTVPSTPSHPSASTVQPVTPYRALDSNTSRAPGADPETATDLDPEDEAPLPDAYKQAVKRVEKEIAGLEDKLPKRGRKRLTKLQPFKFSVTIQADPPYYPRFHIWYIRNVLKDIFGTGHEDNDYCSYDVLNCYTLHDKNITHYSVMLYAELPELLRVLYRLDYTCARYTHTYDHQYKEKRMDRTKFEEYLDEVSDV